MDEARRRTLEYAAPEKRWPLWVRGSLAGAIWGAALAAVWFVWGWKHAMPVYDAAFTQDGYGGIFFYLIVRHHPGPMGIPTTYEITWWCVALCLTLTVGITVQAARAGRRVLQNGGAGGSQTAGEQGQRTTG